MVGAVHFFRCLRKGLTLRKGVVRLAAVVPACALRILGSRK